MDKKTRTNLTVIACGLAISIGPALGGFFVGKAIERFKTSDRTVVVKGLSEREVKADLSIWTIEFKNTGNELDLLEKKTNENKEAIINFLTEQKFNVEEIGPVTIRVVDKLAREYENKEPQQARYVIEGALTVRSEDVEKVRQTLGHISELIKKNVIISGEPEYFYTKFKDVRPQMIAEATQSARHAAMQFANDSDVKVGHIRNANQGAFSITGRDTSSEGYDYRESKSIDKKIRVVSTVTFNLEQ